MPVGIAVALRDFLGPHFQRLKQPVRLVGR